MIDVENAMWACRKKVTGEIWKLPESWPISHSLFFVVMRVHITWIWTFICGLKHIKVVEWDLNLLCKIILYLVQITKLHNCATPTPATKSGVVSYPNMIDTSTKDQMRNPTVNRIQSSTKTLISFFTPMSRRTLTRAYLILQREKASLVM